MTRDERLQVLARAPSLRDTVENQLNRIEAAQSDENAFFFGDDDFPDSCIRSIFLGGPLPPKGNLFDERNWRCRAVQHLRGAGFTGVIYMPEPRSAGLDVNNSQALSAEYFTDWSYTRLYRSNQVLFWIPKGTDVSQLPEVEYMIGTLVGAVIYSDHPERQPAKRPFVGWENGVEHTSVLRRHLTAFAKLKKYNSLGELCKTVAEFAMAK